MTDNDTIMTENYIVLNGKKITDYGYMDLVILLSEKHGFYTDRTMTEICNMLLFDTEKTESFENVERIKELIKTLF